MPTIQYTLSTGNSNSVTVNLAAYDEETLAKINQLKEDRQAAYDQLRKDRDEANKALREELDRVQGRISALESLHYENEHQLEAGYRKAYAEITGQAEG